MSGEQGWNGIERLNVRTGAWECWNVQSMVFLSSVGMLSCRGLSYLVDDPLLSGE